MGQIAIGKLLNRKQKPAGNEPMSTNVQKQPGNNLVLAGYWHQAIFRPCVVSQPVQMLNIFKQLRDIQIPATDEREWLEWIGYRKRSE
jgi:hypothetical protein